MKSITKKYKENSMIAHINSFEEGVESPPRKYTDTVSGRVVYGTLVKLKTTANFAYCSIRQFDGTIALIRI